MSKPFYLQTDASSAAFCVVLEQHKRKENCVIAYASKPLTVGEQNYMVPKLEAVAMQWALEDFKHYINNGQDIIIETDQQCLLNFDKLNSLSAQKTKFMVYLLNYGEHLKVVWKEGASNKAADFLSHLSSDTLEIVSTSDEDSFVNYCSYVGEIVDVNHL